MDNESLGREAFIHWNGPPLHLADNLGRKALDRYFPNNSWNFITQLNRSESTAIMRMETVERIVLFFWALPTEYEYELILQTKYFDSLLNISIKWWKASSFSCFFTFIFVENHALLRTFSGEQISACGHFRTFSCSGYRPAWGNILWYRLANCLAWMAT